MMPMVGAYMGGGKSICEAGSGVVQLDWITEDGENMEGSTFTLAGPQTYTATADSNGHAEITVVAGTYSVTITHGGDYFGDTERTLTVESRREHRLTWVGVIAVNSTVMFTGPALSVASYEIINSQGAVQLAGSGWASSMSFSVTYGEYTLKLSAYGASATLDFSVPKDSVVTVPTDSMFCTVTISGVPEGTSVTSGSNSLGTSPILILNSNSSVNFSFTSPTYSTGLALATISDITVTVSGTTLVVNPTVTPNIYIASSSGAISVPKGTYRVLAIGGGGAGNKGGGGSGRFVEATISLEGTYEFTIGEGGKSSGASGGATSFSTLVSASGGSGASSNTGGAGGAGGGGGANASGAGGQGLDAGGGGSAGGSGSGGKGAFGDGGYYGVKATAGKIVSDVLYINSGYGGWGGGGGAGGNLSGNATGGNTQGIGDAGTGSTSGGGSETYGGGAGGGGIAGGKGGLGGAGYINADSRDGGPGSGLGAGGGGASSGMISAGNTWGGGGGGGGGGYGRTENTALVKTRAGASGGIVMCWWS